LVFHVTHLVFCNLGGENIMKCKTILAVFFAIFLTTSIGHGTDLIIGVIEDAEGKPVSGAEVSIAYSDLQAITDKDGVFEFPCVEGTVVCGFSSPQIADWCWPTGGPKETVTKAECTGGWDYGKIRLKGTQIKSADKIRWALKGDEFEFVDNMDGTVTDERHGLMWANESWKDSDGAMHCWTWLQAKKYCDELNLANYADWRLPTLAELETLPMSVILEGPIYTLNSWWSSDLVDEDKAWTLTRGRRVMDDRTDNNVVLPVRSVKK
jgi:hypothetical protein